MSANNCGSKKNARGQSLSGSNTWRKFSREEAGRPVMSTMTKAVVWTMQLGWKEQLLSSIWQERPENAQEADKTDYISDAVKVASRKINNASSVFPSHKCGWYFHKPPDILHEIHWGWKYKMEMLPNIIGVIIWCDWEITKNNIIWERPSFRVVAHQTGSVYKI